MKVADLMTKTPVRVAPDTTVSAAARMLSHYHIGILPVCRASGRLCGLLTDRDLVTRCMAAGRDPDHTRAGEVMTKQLWSVPPTMEASVAAALMGLRQVRRLPVVEKGRLLGILTLGDLSQRWENNLEVADALQGVSSNVTEGKCL